MAHARPSPGPTPPTTLWLARHGEVHNPAGLFYGRMPRMRLSPEGVRQAHALAALLASRPLAAIYSSPLLRARATARVVAAGHPGLRVRLDRGIMEVRTGWQGVAHDDLESIGWDFYANPRHPDDESPEAIRDRMRDWLRRVLRRHPGQEVAAVSHGDPILILLADLRGGALSTAQFRPRGYIPTACVFRLRLAADGTLLEEAMHVPWAREAA